MSSDLWVITCYFNPCRYKTKRKNFDTFMEGMKATGANVLVAELAFGEEEFELPADPNTFQLRGWGVMWQKERLLNIAAARLPASCTKVAWLDNDVLFENPNWVEQTSKALDKHVVVQPFTSAVRLPRDTRAFDGRGEQYLSHAYIFSQDPLVGRTGEFHEHGHSGFAWAARRELIDKVGLYDPCLTCSGDHLMSHAFAGGMIHSPCVPRMIGTQERYLKHFWNWAADARDMVEGNMGAVPGRLLHLWHGDLKNRRYAELNQQFMTFDFDPDAHLVKDENGLWEWAEAAPKELREWASEMFWLRREDGEGDDEAQDEAEAA